MLETDRNGILFYKDTGHSGQDELHHICHIWKDIWMDWRFQFGKGLWQLWGVPLLLFEEGKEAARIALSFPSLCPTFFNMFVEIGLVVVHPFHIAEVFLADWAHPVHLLHSCLQYNNFNSY